MYITECFIYLFVSSTSTIDCFYCLMFLQDDAINSEEVKQTEEPPKEEEKVEEVKQEEPALDAAEAKIKAALDKRT